jgi:hypothetical protein
MKCIQIEETWINLSNITHFEFSPSHQTEAGSNQRTEPSELSIEVIGNNPLRFFGVVAENGYKKLAESIAG